MLNLLQRNVVLLYPLKISEKPLGFLIFSGDIVMQHWAEMGLPISYSYSSLSELSIILYFQLPYPMFLLFFTPGRKPLVSVVFRVYRMRTLIMNGLKTNNQCSVIIYLVRSKNFPKNYVRVRIRG